MSETNALKGAGRDRRAKGSGTADLDAIAKAHAIYTPLSLPFYDIAVHGLSNRFAWKCPTPKLVELYRRHLSRNHLEAAVGTGLFLDRAGRAFDRLVLLDINTNCLETAAGRLGRFSPECRRTNLLSPEPLDLRPFDSVGLTYVLHCLPGYMSEKLVAVDHLRPSMADGATLFGATILGRDIRPNAPARALLRAYNRRGVFNNLEDDLGALREGLESRFAHVEIAQHGLVALFSAS
ncbi:class I SAM-dependent methyltransferase [Methyloceanibacter sp.]|uniref:class I SAM-dependent methyltransferase n=1 Tax=Methyloceanibacter sp. TaxID=1965321 RepID=UPI002BC79ECF|nr:class I SAM-dependent methyltransferase [Methyloceanibacter sp.]HML92702.1 class I SAM-dependent methyltransferase [Methyloceanibacter sp.]